MTAPRAYAVGDRVVRRGHAVTDVGVVVEVRQDSLPYRVDFGALYRAVTWWSGLSLEPAPDPWAEVAAAAVIAALRWRGDARPSLAIGTFTSSADAGAVATVEIDFAALARSHQDADRRAAHDRAVAEATRAALAKAWAEEQARPAVVKAPSKPVDLFGPGWRERDPMRKAGP